MQNTFLEKEKEEKEKEKERPQTCRKYITEMKRSSNPIKAVATI